MGSVAQEIADKISEQALGGAEGEDPGLEASFDEFTTALADSDSKKAQEALKSYVEIVISKIN